MGKSIRAKDKRRNRAAMREKTSPWQRKQLEKLAEKQAAIASSPSAYTEGETPPATLEALQAEAGELSEKNVHMAVATHMQTRRRSERVAAGRTTAVSAIHKRKKARSKSRSRSTSSRQRNPKFL
eukprot:TRINITY_DN457_c0_g1_i1.p2 TRINITY_DN457_c0_g1~~TRINITY_DN457_c0_g1_i1.p2  ORF type:complete len:143 (-),score=43.74 TRINITY_DN457_c0_g1_i1:317-691(-)